MKTIFRIAALGLVTLAFGAISIFAQDQCPFEKQNELYTTYRAKTKSTVTNPVEIRTGIKAGDEFLVKCATPEQQEVVDFLKKDIPKQTARAERFELLARFDVATKDKKTYNADEAYASGKALAEKEPNFAFDIGAALAMVGFENSIKNPPVDRYNSEAINFAKKAISDVEAGKTSNNYGASAFSCVVKTGTGATATVDHAKSKNCILGRMNYIIGSIMYYNQKAEKEALPYFYKATMIDSPVKKNADIYQAIGGWYAKEIVKMITDRDAKIKLNNDQDNEETLAILAMMKGYAERGINALSKAHTFAAADFKKPIYDKIQGLYEVRFNKKDGVDVYLAAAAAQPLVDPTTPVTPIVEAPVAPTTTTNPTTPTTGGTTKPVAPTTTKPTTNPTTNPTTKPSTTPVKPTVSPTTKPAAKTSTKTKAVIKKKRT